MRCLSNVTCTVTVTVLVNGHSSLACSPFNFPAIRCHDNLDNDRGSTSLPLSHQSTSPAPNNRKPFRDGNASFLDSYLITYTSTIQLHNDTVATGHAALHLSPMPPENASRLPITSFLSPTYTNAADRFPPQQLPIPPKTIFRLSSRFSTKHSPQARRRHQAHPPKRRPLRPELHRAQLPPTSHLPATHQRPARPMASQAARGSFPP